MTQKSYWVTIGRPSTGKGETQLGYYLSFSEARMTKFFFKPSPAANAQSLKSKVIVTGCAVIAIQGLLKHNDIKIDPVQKLHSYPLLIIF